MNLGRVLDVTFDDQRWTLRNRQQAGGVSRCRYCSNPMTGLGATGFTLVETGPDNWCICW